MILDVSHLGGTTAWTSMTWHGETAWTSLAEEVRAIVSEQRSRLIYLGPVDGSVNLLNAPPDFPDECNPHPNQGGHRFWLGPQHRWRWPPPTEWEYSSAMSVAIDGGVLIVKQARIDSAYPALTREYAWEENRLRCTVRWEDDGRPCFGMHIIAVDTPFSISARLEPRDTAPAGLVLARMVDPAPEIELPHPAISVDQGFATVRAGIRELKLGFAPQELTSGRPDGWRLSVHPGPSGGKLLEMPDCGYLSQVWVGDESSDFAEIEQITPYLQADASGQCFSTIFIGATHQT